MAKATARAVSLDPFQAMRIASPTLVGGVGRRQQDRPAALEQRRFERRHARRAVARARAPDHGGGEQTGVMAEKCIARRYVRPPAVACSGAGHEFRGARTLGRHGNTGVDEEIDEALPGGLGLGLVGFFVAQPCHAADHVHRHVFGERRP